jgi:uncharacterized protein with HEPN domain
MTKRDSAIFIRDMLDFARDAAAFVEGRTREDLDADKLFAYAVLRALSLLGEAASRIPAEDRARHPEVPWKAIIGLRNRLIHAYAAINLDIVWRIVREEVPVLVTRPSAIVGE